MRLMEIRPAKASDRPFILEMARLACALEGRPTPAADNREVKVLLPAEDDPTLIAVDDDDHALLGAAWCQLHDPPLVRDDAGRPLPELVIAVCPHMRGQGVGGALLDAIAAAVAAQANGLALNVHLLNPAVRLYVRAGFRVAGQGRGWYGVAMTRWLTASGPDNERDA
jgi:GNAT superfamily N-acetyltransferase